ncbi:predicted protein [Lodderomyces elongisporus NRRL YB-4239]|uniref:Uncharacterized protein n=1 Tax=Lodderomyces elongisporus (strain ATCC 11503 / CBS 2605 / JCM 1781 / NBRC 1676 / NRRL YB-4239) TaxID=379508 RepID=A5DUR4_LODEL|nr:predicted protein [Lodderomyces elongisporus NRRL YB-4239]
MFDMYNYIEVYTFPSEYNPFFVLLFQTSPSPTPSVFHPLFRGKTSLFILIFVSVSISLTYYSRLEHSLFQKHYSSVCLNVMYIKSSVYIRTHTTPTHKWINVGENSKEGLNRIKTQPCCFILTLILSFFLSFFLSFSFTHIHTLSYHLPPPPSFLLH